jgi:hypothetical protein
MQSKRRWLPGWQRVELVCLCLDRGMSRREAASYRRVSVSTVQYWIDRYRRASELEREQGVWAEDRCSTPQRQPARASEAVHDALCEARERTGWGTQVDRRGAGRHVDLARGRDDHAPVTLLAPDAERALVGHCGREYSRGAAIRNGYGSPMQGAA